MSEKQNFSIDPEFLNLESGSGTTSATVARALKLANDNSEDFIRYAKGLAFERITERSAPRPQDFTVGGRLKHNLYVDFKGVKVFLTKGAKAEMSGTILKIEGPRISIVLQPGLVAKWSDYENDFNKDKNCISLTIAEGNNHG